MRQNCPNLSCQDFVWIPEYSPEGNVVAHAALHFGSVERGETNLTLSSLATIAMALKITTAKLVEAVD
jgi:hypothetical protein